MTEKKKDRNPDRILWQYQAKPKAKQLFHIPVFYVFCLAVLCLITVIVFQAVDPEKDSPLITLTPLAAAGWFAYRVRRKLSESETTSYQITGRGVSVQKRFSKQDGILFVRFSDMISAQLTQCNMLTGDVILTYHQPHGNGTQILRLSALPQYETVYDLIRSEMERAKEMPPDEKTDVSELLTADAESVGELTSELFGANASVQGAFPDPTVNPLPVLPAELPAAHPESAGREQAVSPMDS